MATDLLLSYDFPPLGGGIARYMDEIARGYPRGELVVSTGSLPNAEDRGIGNVVDRVSVPSGRLRTLFGLLRWGSRVLQLEEAHRFRFAWCDNIRPSAYPANWLWRRREVPYGVIVHGSDLFDVRRNVRRRRRKNAVARRLLGNAAAIVANSHWTGDLARSLLDELGLSEARPRVRVVPLGTDPARFRPDLDPRSLRKRHQLPGGTWLVTVARLERYKGVDVGLEAMQRLTSRWPELRYAVVGEGPARGELEALAGKLGVADRVHFMGRLPDAELPKMYTLAAVYLGLTRETERDAEGFGISLVEAQGCGRPVIAGRGGGTGDAVRDGETGYLVNPEDPMVVAEAIDSLLVDPEQAARLGAAGRAAVEGYYNWPRVIADLRAIAAELGRRGA